MKKQKTLFQLIGLLVGVVWFSLVWVNPGNTCNRAGLEKACLDRPAGDCGKTNGFFHGSGCGKGDCFLEGDRVHLPSPCGLLYKRDDLGLDDGQLAELKQLKSSARKIKIKRLAELQLLKLELQDLLDKAGIDEKAVEAKLDTIGSLRTRIAKDCVNAKLAARKVLTAEQLKKWNTSGKTCNAGAGSACGRHAPGGKA